MFSISNPIGVPVVLPSNTPDRILTWSGSLRWVVVLIATRTAAVQIALDVRFRQLHSRRAAVHNAAKRKPMALAKGRDDEGFAEAVT